MRKKAGFSLILLCAILFLAGSSVYACTVDSSGLISTRKNKTCSRWWDAYRWIYDDGSYTQFNKYNINWSDGANSQPEFYGLGECRYDDGINCPPYFYSPYYVTTPDRASFKVTITERSVNSAIQCVDGLTTTKGSNHTCSTGGGGGGCLVGETCWDSSGNPMCCPSPIVIDVAGNGFNLTDAVGGVRFDLDNDGVREQLAWTAANSDDVWLALDRNDNGTINNGRELFGNHTPQPEPPQGEGRNGFLALAVYDKPSNGGNNDGQIDSRDTVFSQLRLWRDTNHNGISEASELLNLSTSPIRIIEFDYHESRRTDEHGNRFRYRAKVKDAQGAQVGRWAWDVFLLTQPE